MNNTRIQKLNELARELINQTFSATARRIHSRRLEVGNQFFMKVINASLPKIRAYMKANNLIGELKVIHQDARMKLRAEQGIEKRKMEQAHEKAFDALHARQDIAMKAKRTAKGKAEDALEKMGIMTSKVGHRCSYHDPMNDVKLSYDYKGTSFTVDSAKFDQIRKQTGNAMRKVVANFADLKDRYFTGEMTAWVIEDSEKMHQQVREINKVKTAARNILSDQEEIAGVTPRYDYLNRV